MGLGDLYLISKAGFQSALVLGSLFIIAPMGLSLRDFAGHCPFWATAHWASNGSANSLIVTEWGLPSNCNFGLFIGCAQLVVCLAYLCYIGVHICLQRDASFLTVFLGLQVSLFFAIALLMEAVIVTGGLFQWCLLMSSENRFPLGCEQAQFGLSLPDYPDIYTQRFFFTFGIARIGLWFSCLVWSFDLLLMFAHMVRLHKQERFLVSLRREANMMRGRLYRDPAYVNI